MEQTNNDPVPMPLRPTSTEHHDHIKSTAGGEASPSGKDNSATGPTPPASYDESTAAVNLRVQALVDRIKDYINDNNWPNPPDLAFYITHEEWDEFTKYCELDLLKSCHSLYTKFEDAKLYVKKVENNYFQGKIRVNTIRKIQDNLPDLIKKYWDPMYDTGLYHVKGEPFKGVVDGYASGSPGASIMMYRSKPDSKLGQLWPYFLIEVGWSQKVEDLNTKGKWYMKKDKELNGHVTTIVLIKMAYTPPDDQSKESTSLPDPAEKKPQTSKQLTIDHSGYLRVMRHGINPDNLNSESQIKDGPFQYWTQFRDSNGEVSQDAPEFPVDLTVRDFLPVDYQNHALHANALSEHDILDQKVQVSKDELNKVITRAYEDHVMEEEEMAAKRVAKAAKKDRKREEERKKKKEEEEEEEEKEKQEEDEASSAPERKSNT